MKPTTLGGLKKIIQEIETSWTPKDEEFLGRLDDQLILHWIPKGGYAHATVKHFPEWGGFLVTALNQDGTEML